MSFNENAEQLMRRIRDSVSQRDHASLATAMYDVNSMILRRGEYDAAVFQLILDLAEEPQTLEMEGSWVLLKSFQDMWSYLSGDQRDRLLQVVDTTFGSSGDWMWSFMIGVLLAECYQNREALDRLSRFRNSGSEEARSLIPDALRNLGRHTSDADVKSGARVELERMVNDPSGEVRREAEDALARWK